MITSSMGMLCVLFVLVRVLRVPMMQNGGGHLQYKEKVFFEMHFEYIGHLDHYL